MAGQCFGSAIAPFIVVPLAENFGWRSVFFVIGLIGLVWVAVCFYWFRNNPSEAKEISPEEKYLVTFSLDDRTVYGWNIDKGKVTPDNCRFNNRNFLIYERVKMCVSDDKKFAFSYHYT